MFIEKIKFILLLLISTFASIEITAQENKISGIVIGASDQPLVGATILIQATQQGTVSDTDGTFLLTGIEDGEYTISASYIGYETKTKTIVVNSDQYVTFRLMENAEELSTVVVQGKAKRDEQGNLTVAASEVFVRKP